MASRLVGFGRWVVFAKSVGDTGLGEVYQAVNTIPNVVFEIVAGGALASIVVPLLAGAIARGDRAEVSATASALLTWTLSALIPLAVLVAVFPRPIVAALTDDVTAAQLETGTRMLRVFAPQLPLYGVGIVLTGVLQAHRRFAWPVLAPLLSSIVVICTYLSFAAVEGRRADLPAVGRPGESILAAGTTLGVVVLALCLVVPVRRLRLGWRAAYRFAPDTRRVLGGLAVAGAATVAGQQVALVVALKLGFGGPVGTVVQYPLAQTVYLLPWAVLAVPLATAAYPTLATAWAERDHRRYASTLAPAARGVLLLSCLGAAGLVAVASPAAEFLLTGDGVAPLAAAIAGLAPGLLGYSLFALLSRALYARGANRTAALGTLAGWAVAVLATVVLALALPGSRRALALALGNSAGMLALGAVLVFLVARRSGRESLTGLARSGLVGVLAGGLAAPAGLGAGRLPGALLDSTPPAAAALLRGTLSGGVTVVVFLTLAYALDRHDARPMVLGGWRRLRRLAGGRSGDNAIGDAQDRIGRDGDGLDGDGRDGDGRDRDGLDGDGLDGDGRDGTGLDGDSRDGTGLDGDGLDGDGRFGGGRVSDGRAGDSPSRPVREDGAGSAGGGRGGGAS